MIPILENTRNLTAGKAPCMSIKVAIADDQQLFLKSLSMLVSSFNGFSPTLGMAQPLLFRLLLKIPTEQKIILYCPQVLIQLLAAGLQVLKGCLYRSG